MGPRDVKRCTVYGVIGTQHILNKYHMPSVSHLAFASKMKWKYVLHLLALVQQILLKRSKHRHKTGSFMSLLTPMLHHSNCVIWGNFTAWTAAFRQTSVPKFRMQDEPLFNFETTSVASRSTLRIILTAASTK